ncbi:hypothetical protein EVAR_51239_1 [Eumeta japonica]|uniref:Uncharacterized protein n=1 Tax=Eumeta variegata TaxID=151549 RepID=A0A4C1X330_EUMVA|nr:hypothetical protein EVAR_51239_1 [Eumeta japonica]
MILMIGLSPFLELALNKLNEKARVYAREEILNISLTELSRVDVPRSPPRPASPPAPRSERKRATYSISSQKRRASTIV